MGKVATKFTSILMTLALVFSICGVSYMLPGAASTAYADDTVKAASTDGAKAAGDFTLLGFTSDTHNKSDNTAATRLGTWLDKMASLNGGQKVEVMAFGGDMADASASASNYWTYTAADVTQLTNRSVEGVITTGNHEHSPGNYSASSTNATQQLIKIGKEGKEGSNYRIYCLGSESSSQSYSTSQVNALTSYLNSVDNSKPIFIITHFPLHYYSSGGGSGWSWGGRTTSGASNVIDALNAAVEDNNQTIVFLWGHNHTSSDTYYDQIYGPGGTTNIEYSSGNSKDIKFYYGGAGCMSDNEYSSGSASVKGKGLLVKIEDSKISLNYYNESGTDVSESNSIKEITLGPVETVDVTGVTVSPSSVEVPAGETTTLTATVAPSNASNKKVDWSSSDTSVATVDANGVVTGVKAGSSTTITATTRDGSFKASCRVTVTTAPEGTKYVLTDSLQNGGEYIIANGNTGSVYVVSNEANGSRTLKGISASVSGNTITLSGSNRTKAAFTAESNANSSQGGVYLKNGDNYLYADSNDGLRMVGSSTQTGSSNNAKSWHYKGDSKNILWFFKDTSSQDGYTDTSSTYKYYLECSNGNFTDNHVSTTNLANTSTPAMYIYVRSGSVTPVSVTGVTLDKTSASVKAGKTLALTATVAPSNASNKAVSWSSSNTSVATVDQNGTVTALKEGTATITVTTDDGGKTATCTVTVTAASAGTKYELATTLEAGKSYIIANGNSGSVYVVSNEANGSRTLKGVSANVSNNTITLSEDEAEIAEFAAVANSNSAQNGLYLTNGGKYLYADSNSGLRMETSSTQTSSSNNAKSWHYKADNKNILWFFKDTSSTDGYTDTSQTYKYYLECSNGNFTDNHVSTTSLGNTSTPAMYIYTEAGSAAPVAATGVTLDKSTATVKAGKTIALTATVQPTNATNKAVTWSSSASGVATVDANGTVTGVAAGTATITVTTADGGYKATCVVTVTESTYTKYELATTLEAGKSYIIANGKTGSVYVVSNESGGSRMLKGISATVGSDGKLTLTDDEAEKAEFAAVANSNSAQGGVYLTNGGKYLYTDSNTGLRMAESGTQTGNDNQAKSWHYKADSKNILWFFKDTGSSDGYTDTSQTYKYYLEMSGTNFTDNHVSTTSLSNSSNLPAMYIYTESADTPHSHTWDNGVVTTAATCTKDGVKTFTCTGCGETKTETIPATGHTAMAVAGKAATCTESGLTEGQKCSVCGETLVAQQEIPALGHNFGEWVTTKDPTCTEPGVETSTCSRCGATETREIAALGHKFGSAVVTKMPTCEEEGVLTMTCSVCGEKSETPIAANGHTWNAPTYIPIKGEDGKYTGVTAERVCSVCGATETETAEVDLDKTVVVEPTETENGSIVYAFKDFENAAFSAPSFTMVLPATGHQLDYENIEWVWTGNDVDGYTSVTATAKCVNYDTDEYAVDSTVVPTVTTTDPTCTADGATVWSASVAFDSKIYTDKKTIVIPATGHSAGEAVQENVVAPTCTEAGSYDMVVRCTVCGEVVSSESFTVDALGHKASEPFMDADTLVPATCIATGSYEEVVKCTVCEAELSRETKTIDMIAHDFGAWRPMIPATCTEKGAEIRYCNFCGATERQELAALGHSWDEGKVTTEPTSEKEGVKTFECKTCGEKKTESIAKVSPSEDKTKVGEDGTALGPGASAAAAEAAILGMTNDGDPKGSNYLPLELQSKKQTNNSITIKWVKQATATKYVVYGNLCGKSNKMAKICEVKGSKASKKLKKIAGKKLKAGKAYKIIIVALDKDGMVVSTSKLIHVYTKGGKKTNHKAVAITQGGKKVSSLTVKAGGKVTIAAEGVNAQKGLGYSKHVQIRFCSSKVKIATVTKKGVLTAKKKGTCYIYAYSQDGVAKKVKLTVK